MSTGIRWAFEGPLAELPSGRARMVLLLVAAIALAWTAAGYALAARRVGWARAGVLALLRLAFLGCVIAFLANPLRVETVMIRPPPRLPAPPRRLAVLVDRSDSMRWADNRGQRRIDAAAATWRRLGPAARTAFGRLDYFSFANNLRPEPSEAAALKARGASGETHLNEALLSLLRAPAARRPQEIVVLTDGQDTGSAGPAPRPGRPTFASPEAPFVRRGRPNAGESSTALEGADRVLVAALAAQVPISFVPATNRTPPQPYLRVREWRAPSVAARHTLISMQAVFEAFALHERDVAYTLYEDDKQIGSGSLSLRLGANLIPRTFAVPAGEPGTRQVVLRWNADEDSVAASVVARAAVIVQSEQPIRVLVDQAALDWGFRTLTDGLRADPGVRVTAVFDSGPDQKASTAFSLPSSPDAYRDYDAVILGRVDGGRLSAAQRGALETFVSRGGGVLFIAPDDPEGDLGPLLPVVAGKDGLTLQTPHGDPDALLLPAFQPTESGLRSGLFAAPDGEELLPRFDQWVRASLAKPGAEVLALHREAVDPATGAPDILMARQTVGEGRSYFLATDGLWRWKLSEPSTSHAVETFWQQLLRQLARREAPAAAVDVKPPVAHETPRGEASRTPADIDGMRRLATTTGGALLTDEAPASWRAPVAEAAPKPVRQEKRRLLWDTWLWLSLTLAFFTLELGLRRLWKLA